MSKERKGKSSLEELDIWSFLRFNRFDLWIFKICTTTSYHSKTLILETIEDEAAIFTDNNTVIQSYYDDVSRSDFLEWTMDGKKTIYESKGINNHLSKQMLNADPIPTVFLSFESRL